ncbi:MAG TPA: class I SAM-dependent methyltransferase [Gemmatimonadaceae bacterium]|nr:class I SAM-dependent methyltransferase [Gemmatimonadaceae bacterium]
MSERLLRATGWASTALDTLLALRRRPRHPTVRSPGQDKTGIHLRDPEPLELLWCDDEILYARYRSFAHSFWRAQELSLFRKYLDRLPPPRLDFGTGDGSFASVLLREVEFGVDTDATALALASRWGIYRQLVNSTDCHIPLPDRVVQSVFSNSVLEHVAALDAILAELARILAPSGVLAFTVPVRRYTEHLQFYFGAAASDRINRESFHLNLLSEEEWMSRLRRCRFRPVLVRQYQPGQFTFWYRMFRLLGPNGLGRVPQVPAHIWHRWGDRIVAMVRQSITQTEFGANIFVMAERLSDNNPAASRSRR